MNSKVRWLLSIAFLTVGLAASAADTDAVPEGEARLTRIRASVDVPMRKPDSGMDGDLAHYTRPHEFKTIKRSYKVRETKGSTPKRVAARKTAPR